MDHCIVASCVTAAWQNVIRWTSERHSVDVVHTPSCSPAGFVLSGHCSLAHPDQAWVRVPCWSLATRSPLEQVVPVRSSTTNSASYSLVGVLRGGFNPFRASAWRFACACLRPRPLCGGVSCFAMGFDVVRGHDTLWQKGPASLDSGCNQEKTCIKNLALPGA